MKKGFTMIELIFVIVILGILASVAIPRLAATREDAEISTTIANLRALISEVSSYYVGHGTFGAVPWSDVTNVPLKSHDNGNGSTITVTTAADATGTNVAYLVAGGEPCIGVHLVNRARRGDGTYSPAHIKLTQHTNATTASSVCQQVRNSQVVADYFRSSVPGTGDGTTPISAAIPVGSTKGIYRAAPSS